MKLEGKVVLLTGAGSGIGQQLAYNLAQKGAVLLLVGRTREKLLHTLKNCIEIGAKVDIITADISDLEKIPELVETALKRFGGIDILINNAGVISFKHIENESTENLEKMFRTNVLAPMAITRELIPHLKSKKEAAIVNTGSIFGSIAFAYFSVYCSTKFAMRGFSEALRRELQDTNISVTYAAPRATKTGLASVFGQMAQKVGMKMDDPALVAQVIIKGLEKKRKNIYIGFPECLFVRINSLFPGIVDSALYKQNTVMAEFAE